MNINRIQSLLIMLVFGCIGNQANMIKAQQFVNPGAEWMFWSNVDGGGYTAYTRWKYTSDTTINNLNYQKISVTMRNSIPYSPDFPDVSGGYTSLISLNPFLFRSSGDSLFIANIDGSNEYLLYDFTPVVGNSWDASPLINWLTIEPTGPLIIETVAFGDTLINGQVVNWVEVESNNPDTLIFSGRIYNHFGKQQVFPHWEDGTLHNSPLTWKCYYDDLLGSIGISPCLNIETLSIQAVEESAISIIPNAEENRIEIQRKNVSRPAKITVCDIAGRRIVTYTNIDSDLIRFNQPVGIYVISFEYPEYVHFQKFFWPND